MIIMEFKTVMAPGESSGMEEEYQGISNASVIFKIVVKYI